jgi:hypothetical protein
VCAASGAGGSAFLFARRWLFEFLIAARLAEFNPLLPCFPATYFAVALIPDSLL